jgi:hypothetical protein
MMPLFGAPIKKAAKTLVNILKITAMQQAFCKMTSSANNNNNNNKADFVERKKDYR